MTADLDLRVRVSEEGEVSRSEPADEIPRAIDPPVDRMLDELLARELGAVQISARHADAADAELAGLPGSHLAERRVEDPRRAVGHRAADGHRLAFPYPAARHGDGAFGRAVAVLQPTSRRPAAHDVLGQLFAPHVEETKVGQLARRVVAGAHAEQRRRRAEDVDPFGAQPRHEIRTQAHHVVVHHDERRPGSEREPDLLDGRVVGGGRALTHAVPRPEPESVEIRVDEAHDAPVLDQHPLRPAGAAGGVDHVAERRGGQPGRLRRSGSLHVRRRVHHHRAIGRESHPGEQAVRRWSVGGSDDRHRLRVFEDETGAFGGRAWLQARVGATGLQHRQLRHIDPMAPARQEDGDHALGRDERRKARRKGTGEPVDRRVGEALAGCRAARGDLDRDSFRKPECGALENLMQELRVWPTGGLHVRIDGWLPMRFPGEISL